MVKAASPFMRCVIVTLANQFNNVLVKVSFHVFALHLRYAFRVRVLNRFSIVLVWCIHQCICIRVSDAFTFTFPLYQNTTEIDSDRNRERNANANGGEDTHLNGIVIAMLMVMVPLLIVS